jgi:hypothetical protein
MASFIDSLRAAADNGLGVVAATSLSPYTCTVVTVSNDQVNFDDATNTRVRVDTPIYVGSGVGPNLNPHVQYLEKWTADATTVLSARALMDLQMMMGPIVYPYNTGYQSGGFNTSNFAPNTITPKAVQVYVWLQGPGLNPINGNYFKVIDIVLNGMDNIFYYVKLQAIQDVVQ